MKKKESMRKRVRRHIYFYLSVYEASGEKMIGHLGDISQEGVMLVSKEELELNKELDVKIELPKKEPFNRKKVPLTIRLLWQKADSNPDYLCYGGLIKEIPPITRKVIGALLYMYGFLDEQSINSEDILL